MLIRPARLDDAESIADIYNVEVRDHTTVFEIEPRTVAAQRAWLAERSGVHAVIVADLDGEVIGWASLSPYRERAAYNTTVENSVFVERGRQGSGVGRALLTRLVEVAREHGFHAVIARIAGDNSASIALHQSLGFELVGVEREVGRKFGRWIDITELQLLL